MNRSQYATLIGQGLSYGLIITFIFADTRYNFTGLLRNSGIPITIKSAYIASCLIGFVGVMNLWLTWFYTTKFNRVSNMLVICAWTHQVKTSKGWVSLETFFAEQLGYAISHGLSDEKYREMRDSIDKISDISPVHPDVKNRA